MAAEVRAVEADIPMGMTQIEDGDAKVLLVRDETGLRAFQAGCPHYGAPLADGRLCGRTLYCPWHKAAFDIGDGALLEPPALQGLDQYPIRHEGEKIVVTLDPIKVSRPSAHAHDKRTFVIVGSGAAATSAIVTLRHEGFGGRLVVVGMEEGEPYDRPMLSKDFLAEKTDPSEAVPDPGFFASHKVEFLMGPATRIDVETRQIKLANGTLVEADALLVATGSEAVMPKVSGGDLGNIFTLRSLADALKLSEAAEPGRQIAIVGGGFISLEAAAFLTKRGLVVTVISNETLPLAARFGDEVAHGLKVYHEGTGVRFVEGRVARFEGTGDVREVRLEGGETIATDLVLIGVGAKPRTEAIDGVRKRDDGSIEVDAELRVAPGVWLAGDIAAFPEPRSDTTARIEHWRLAEQHGAHAACGMLGHASAFRAAPFFWSNQGDKRLDYAGYAPNWDRIVMKGNPAKLDFIAYYVREDKVLAACAIGQARNPDMIAFLHALDQGHVPDAQQLDGQGLRAVA